MGVTSHISLTKQCTEKQGYQRERMTLWQQSEQSDRNGLGISCEYIRGECCTKQCIICSAIAKRSTYLWTHQKQRHVWQREQWRQHVETIKIDKQKDWRAPTTASTSSIDRDIIFPQPHTRKYTTEMSANMYPARDERETFFRPRTTYHQRKTKKTTSAQNC